MFRADPQNARSLCSRHRPLPKDGVAKLIEAGLLSEPESKPSSTKSLKKRRVDFTHGESSTRQPAGLALRPTNCGC
jgi:hypothetical protein